MYQVQQHQHQKQKQSPPGLCFKCRKPGHWSKDCPENTCNRSPVSKPVFSDDKYTKTQCRCGAGFCNIVVSNSVKNPGEKYYQCPGEWEMNCGYFKWCKYEVIREVQPQRYPICRCQAGVCFVFEEENGVNAGRSYFACRIKKGDGACNFKQWVDEFPEVASVGSDNPLAVQTNLMDEFELSSEGVMQLDAVEMILRENKNIQKHRAEDEGEGEMPREACHLAMETLAMENYVPEDMDLKMTIQCSESLTNKTCNSPVHSMQGYPTAAIAANNGSPQGSLPNLNSVTEHLSPSNSQPRGGILSNLQSPLKAGVREGDMMSSSVSAKFGMFAAHIQNDLVTTLESISPQNHISMLKEAETTFAALNSLQVDYKPFQSRVNEYISRAASLAHIEQIINEESSLHELVNHRNKLQQHFKELSKSYDEARAAYLDSSLYEKALSLDTSVESAMEVSSRLETLLQINKALTECKESLNAASRKAEEALNKFKELEIELNEVQVAFQIARAQLRN